MAAGPMGEPRFRVLRQAPLLALRPSFTELYLLSPAASPIGGDQVTIRLVLERGVRLTVRSAAASIARRGPQGFPSRLEIQVTLEAGASLCWLVEPTVLADRAIHMVESHLDLEEGASLWWRDATVLGCSGEAGGCGRLRMAVDRNGQPVVRHEIHLVPRDRVLSGPAGLAGARVVGSVLATVRADRPVPEPVNHPNGTRVVVLRTANPTLVFVQGLANGWRQLEEAWGAQMSWAASVDQFGGIPD